MSVIFSFINWVVRILGLLWSKFFGVIAGFFVWLFPAIKSFFSRKIATGRFFASFERAAISVCLTAYCSVFSKSVQFSP